MKPIRIFNENGIYLKLNLLSKKLNLINFFTLFCLEFHIKQIDKYQHIFLCRIKKIIFILHHINFYMLPNIILCDAKLNIWDNI